MTVPPPRPRPGGDDGVTLVELMVVLVLAGIVLGVLTSSLIQAQRTVVGTLQRQNDLGQARIAMDAVTADLRALTTLQGVLFATATDSEVVFYADRDIACTAGAPGPPPTAPACTGPVRIRLQRTSAGELVREATRPAPGSGRTPALTAYPSPTPGPQYSRRVLARGLRADQAVFQYHASFAYRGTPTPTPEPSNLPTAGSPPSLPAASIPQVRFIEVTLLVDPLDARAVGPTRLRAVVPLAARAPR